MRSFHCRVVVVFLIAVALSIAAAPALQAAPREAPVGQSWVEEAREWLSRLLGNRELKEERKLSSGSRISNSGPCIDPLGRPKPCP